LPAMPRCSGVLMCTYRRMMRIPWTQHVTNVEVLRRMEKGVEILHEVKKGKLQYLGQVMRGKRYEILQLIIQEKIVGRRSVGLFVYHILGIGPFVRKPVGSHNIA